MTRPERLSRKAAPPEVSGGRTSQHISSIAHLFFSEDEVPSPGQAPVQEGQRLLVVGSGRASLAPNLAAGLSRQILAAGERLGADHRSGRDTSLRQVFLGEPVPVHFSAFNHLPADSFRPPRPEETVPWEENRGSSCAARVFSGAVPGEDFTAGRERGRYFVRHMDLPRERELEGLEAQLSAGEIPSVRRDGAQGLIWCVTAEEGPSLQEASRLGRLLRLACPDSLLVVLVGQEGRSDPERRLRMERLVGFVAAEVPVSWHEIGTDRSERLALQEDLARLLAP